MLRKPSGRWAYTAADGDKPQVTHLVTVLLFALTVSDLQLLSCRSLPTATHKIKRLQQLIPLYVMPIAGLNCPFQVAVRHV
jgi:hypothetical protein